MHQLSPSQRLFLKTKSTLLRKDVILTSTLTLQGYLSPHVPIFLPCTVPLPLSNESTSSIKTSTLIES